MRVIALPSSRSAFPPPQAVAKPQVENMINGFNGCCFAYGQTGSGKRAGNSKYFVLSLPVQIDKHIVANTPAPLFRVTMCTK